MHGASVSRTPTHPQGHSPGERAIVLRAWKAATNRRRRRRRRPLPDGSWPAAGPRLARVASYVLGRIPLGRSGAVVFAREWADSVQSACWLVARASCCIFLSFRVTVQRKAMSSRRSTGRRDDDDASSGCLGSISQDRRRRASKAVDRFSPCMHRTLAGVCSGASSSNQSLPP